MNYSTKYGNEDIIVSKSDSHVSMKNSCSNANHFEGVEEAAVKLVEKLNVQLNSIGNSAGFPYSAFICGRFFLSVNQ